jgi:hypothetical protein
MRYDAAASIQAAQDPANIKFLNWLRDNGAIFDKIEYPAIYDGGLKGCRLKEDVGSNEAFLYIPTKVQILTQTARKSEIGAIFLNHDAIFMA